MQGRPLASPAASRWGCRYASPDAVPDDRPAVHDRRRIQRRCAVLPIGSTMPCRPIGRHHPARPIGRAETGLIPGRLCSGRIKQVDNVDTARGVITQAVTYQIPGGRTGTGRCPFSVRVLCRLRHATAFHAGLAGSRLAVIRWTGFTYRLLPNLQENPPSARYICVSNTSSSDDKTNLAHRGKEFKCR